MGALKPDFMKPEQARADLERVREWADSKIASGSEPPFAWYQYMKLVEAADAILGGFKMTMPGDSQQSESRPESGLRLVVSNCHRDDVPRHLRDPSEHWPK
jgi:hypothetical protein